MKRTVLLAGMTFLVTGLTLGGCGGGEQPQTESQTVQQEPAAQPTETYPIDWCIVSGEKLGSMGEPYAYTHAGRTVKFCCQGCVSTFEANPGRYLARLDSAAAGLITAPGAEPANEDTHGGGTGG